MKFFVSEQSRHRRHTVPAIAAEFAIVMVILGIAFCQPVGAVPINPMASPRQEPSLHDRAKASVSQAKTLLLGSNTIAQKCEPRAIEGYFAAAQAAWNAIWLCPDSRDVVDEASEIYSQSLRGLLESASKHGRIDPARGILIGPKWGRVVIPIVTQGLPVDASVIEAVLPAPLEGSARITRRHTRCGFGLPVAVRTKAKLVSGEFAPPRQSIAATAVLRFSIPLDKPNKLSELVGLVHADVSPAVLDLANPVEIARVQIGSIKNPLAADFTAPLLDMLAGMPKSGLNGFMNPFSNSLLVGEQTQPRLEMLEPHQAGRIPVVFIHGLVSDEGTWFDMINELRMWPPFHRYFEPWVFHYPTGSGFLHSSAVLRKELTAAMAICDPQGQDSALRHMVMVGHSLGGIHAKLQVIDSGVELWNAVACVPFESLRMSEKANEEFRSQFFFEARPFIRRVICIATPHRGSTIASLGIGRVSSMMVKKPQELVELHREMVDCNPGAFFADYSKGLPTTVDILQPNSKILQAIEHLHPRCTVAMHSVIGNEHQSLTSGPGDCVVSMASAKTSGAVSELIVPATHVRVHHHPLTIDEVEAILTEHLRGSGVQ